MEEREPSKTEKYLMTVLGFDTVSEMIDWMNSEKDQELLDELDGPDLEEEFAIKNGYETEDEPEDDEEGGFFRTRFSALAAKWRAFWASARA